MFAVAPFVRGHYYFAQFNTVPSLTSRSATAPPCPAKVKDMDDAGPGRPPLERLRYRYRSHELGRAAMQPLHRIPELVRANFRTHGSILGDLPARARLPRSSADGLRCDWLADILRQQQRAWPQRRLLLSAVRAEAPPAHTAATRPGSTAGPMKKRPLSDATNQG